MAGKKPLSPGKFRAATVKHLKKQPKQKMGAKAMATMAKGRTKHYNKGVTLAKQVSDVLKDVAANHPSAKMKKRAKLAISKLNEAQNAFGTASLCLGSDWGKDDG